MEKKCERKVDSKKHVDSLSRSASCLPKDICRKKKCNRSVEKNELLDDETCPVCIEYPHNAVLLICSSYNKGCRPYMCATSHLHSNCLKQFTKGHKNVSEIKGTKEQIASLASSNSSSHGIHVKTMLLCPLCRGQVKGWTVEEQARRFLNLKKRTCMQDNCSYLGNFKELQKHIKHKHPGAKPRTVDPARIKEWNKLESKRERDDVICAVVQSIPGAIVVGDYVIDPPPTGFLVFVRRCFASLKCFNVRDKYNGVSRRRVHRNLNDQYDNLDYLERHPPAAASGWSFRRMLCWR